LSREPAQCMDHPARQTDNTGSHVLYCIKRWPKARQNIEHTQQRAPHAGRQSSRHAAGAPARAHLSCSSSISRSASSSSWRLTSPASRSDSSRSLRLRVRASTSSYAANVCSSVHQVRHFAIASSQGKHAAFAGFAFALASMVACLARNFADIEHLCGTAVCLLCIQSMMQ